MANEPYFLFDDDNMTYRYSHNHQTRTGSGDATLHHVSHERQCKRKLVLYLNSFIIFDAFKQTFTVMTTRRCNEPTNKYDHNTITQTISFPHIMISKRKPYFPAIDITWMIECDGTTTSDTKKGNYDNNGKDWNFLFHYMNDMKCRYILSVIESLMGQLNTHNPIRY